MRAWAVALIAGMLAGCAADETAAGRPAPAPWHRGERYEAVGENGFVSASEQPKVTFALDVDTASYALMRRDLRSGHLPHPDGVRLEEYLNTFDYGYEAPAIGQDFAAHLEAAPSPFGEGLYLVRLGLKARTVAERGRANLTFLVDVSASMEDPEKLPLVKRTLEILLEELRPDDRVALVVYAGAVGTVLEPTPATERERILEAIRRLGTGGSTNGAGGIRAAYEMARSMYTAGGINRVILCTDGDFNVGLVGDALVDLIAQQRESGVFLTTLGFGRGNYNDRDMQRLAHHGNGNYAFIDGEEEALRVVKRDLLATMLPVAKDARAQVAFDASSVARYRLLGYENRLMPEAAFGDEVDAGEVGAGHDVTVLFEVELLPEATNADRELLGLELRYEDPWTGVRRTLLDRMTTSAVLSSFEEASPSFRFAAAVAEFAEILRFSEHSEGARFDEIRAIAAPLAEGDPDREEFLELVDRAAAFRSTSSEPRRRRRRRAGQARLRERRAEG